MIGLMTKFVDALRLVAIAISDALPYRLFVGSRAALYRLAGVRVGERACIYGRQIVAYPQRLTIGDGCFVNAACIFENEGAITIGTDTYVGPGVAFLTTNHVAATMTNVARPIAIGARCWIGARAIVLPGCVLADDTVVAAGAVMLGRRYDERFYAGVPAASKKREGDDGLR